MFLICFHNFRDCLVPLERLGLHTQEFSNDDPTKEFQTNRRRRTKSRRVNKYTQKIKMNPLPRRHIQSINSANN